MSKLTALIALLVILLISTPSWAQRPVEIVLHSAEAGNVAGTTPAVTGFISATVQVTVAGGWDGTATFGVSTDGTNYTSVLCRDVAAGNVATTATAAGTYVCPIAGADLFRAIISGRTVGAVTATAQFVGPGSGLPVVSVSPGTGALDLGKAEDAAHASGHVGLMSLGVRNDAAAVRADADGDYIPLATDSSGRVGIADLGGSITVDAPATAPVHVRQSDGAAAQTWQEFDADTGAGIANRIAVGLWVSGAGGAVNLTGDAANGLDTDVTRVIPGTGATNLGKAEDAAHVSSDTGVMALCVRRDTASSTADLDGDYVPCTTDSAGRVWIATATGAGAPQVQGTAADGAAAVGNPVQVGGVDSVGNVQRFLTDTAGRLETDTELPAAAALSDAVANPTSPMVGAAQMLFDGTDFDRARTIGAADGSVGVGIPAAGLVAFNASAGTYVRLFTASLDAAAIAQVLEVVPGLYNTSTVDRQRSAVLATFPVASTLTARNVAGVALVEKPARWSVISNPAAGSQATASIAAEIGVRHVADCVAFAAAATTAPALTALTVNLRDGATGAGTIIWSYQVAVGATTGQLVAPHTVCGLNLAGTTNTAMTFEFSAALANLIESVSVSGYNVN